MSDDEFDIALNALIQKGIVIQIPDSEGRLAYYVNPQFRSLEANNN